MTLHDRDETSVRTVGIDLAHHDHGRLLIRQ